MTKKGIFSNSTKRGTLYQREYRKRTNYASDRRSYAKHEKECKERVQQWCKKIKLEVRIMFGNSCIKCGKTTTLHLHHKYYASDSVKPTQHGFNRQYEAYKHPERFELLCAKCHKAEHKRMVICNA